MVNTSLTADLIDAGTYDLDDMKTLLATHISRFDTAYSPTSSTRIMRYLRTRARDIKVDFPNFAKPKGKGKAKGKSNPTVNSKRTYEGTQHSMESNRTAPTSSHAML